MKMLILMIFLNDLFIILISIYMFQLKNVFLLNALEEGMVIIFKMGSVAGLCGRGVRAWGSRMFGLRLGIRLV